MLVDMTRRLKIYILWLNFCSCVSIIVMWKIFSVKISVSVVWVLEWTLEEWASAPLLAQLVESTYNAGDPSWIPGWGRSTGEGIGYALEYSWASLVAQLVKNPPVMWETWVRSLGWEDPLEKGTATHSSILSWRSPQTVLSMESQRVRQDWATFTFREGLNSLLT